jgi:hypothetical protein
MRVTASKNRIYCGAWALWLESPIFVNLEDGHIYPNIERPGGMICVVLTKFSEAVAELGGKAPGEASGDYGITMSGDIYRFVNKDRSTFICASDPDTYDASYEKVTINSGCMEKIRALLDCYCNEWMDEWA